MALHDTDKNTQSRISPSTSDFDKVDPEARMAHETTQITNKDQSDPEEGKTIQTQATWKVQDGDGLDRVLIGYQNDGFGSGNDYGIKVSQDGVDVETADDDELVMSSAFNTFKIAEVLEGEFTKSASSIGTFVFPNFAGSYSNPPAVVGYLDVNYGGNLLNPTPYIEFDSSGNMDLFAEVSNIESGAVKISIDTPSTGSRYSQSITVTYKIYVLIETAEAS